MDFSLDYGLPGKPGYDYSRPFDYFNFQMAAFSSTVIDSLANRGMILDKSLEAGSAYRGIVGLHGSYEYLLPQLFRVANKALSLGTTGQWWLSKNIAVQGTGMAGIGYASVGTLRGAAERDYSYGIAPQALLALRLIFSDKAALDVTARKYFVRDATTSGGGGRDNILRADASLTMRMHKRHALSVKYVFSRRDAFFPQPGRAQAEPQHHRHFLYPAGRRWFWRG